MNIQKKDTMSEKLWLEKVLLIPKTRIPKDIQKVYTNNLVEYC